MGVAENRATEMDIVFYREHVGNTMISHWISGVTHVFSQFGDLPHAQLVGLDGQESLSGQFEPVLLIVRLPQHPKNFKQPTASSLSIKTLSSLRHE